MQSVDMCKNKCKQKNYSKTKEYNVSQVLWILNEKR